jgi:hypothetical protein
MVTGDFNEDGHFDLAVANESEDNVSILTGNGDGTFNTKVHYDAQTYRNYAIVTADFDQDGHLDLATANSKKDVSVLFGRGDATFSHVVKLPVKNLTHELPIFRKQCNVAFPILF